MKALRFILSVPRRAQVPLRLEVARKGFGRKVGNGGASIHVDSEAPVISCGDSIWVIGILFSRQTSKRVTQLPDEALTSESAEEIAKWLLREYWGGYVAILRCPLTNTIKILADPSGFCPVYCAETQSHILVATHISLLANPGGATMSPSYPAMWSFLARTELRQRETCLSGVSELGYGALISLTGERQTKYLWRAEDFMPKDVPLTFDGVSNELASVASMVCGAWGKVFGPVTVAASGGVDSSLICAALSENGLPFSCATVATSDPSGDERRFVQRLAAPLKTDVFENIYDLSDMDPQRSVSHGLARPSKKAFMAAFEKGLFRAAADAGTDIVFDGNGGDNLFCFLHSSAPVVDRLRCEGLGPGALSTFRDMCLVTGCDVPTMARATIRRLVQRHKAPSWSADFSLLTPKAFGHDHFDPLTPWLRGNSKHHSGKKEHLALIMRSQLHIHGLGSDGLPRFSPLLSQPLLEFCLRVPTWLWCMGGKNRAPARAAFASHLPREIVERTSKAGPDSFIHKYFHANSRQLRAVLLEGLLVQNNVIDRNAVSSAFDIGNPSSEIVLRLLDLCEAECWTKSWQS